MKPDKVNKKTVYVDVDEEITSVIDKLRSANDTIVALVLPRRATMFQSVVNMKLLKRAADQDNKKVVLITSEPGLLPLAGAVGLHVAPNLSSKPHIPEAPARPEPNKELNAHEPKIDPESPIGAVMAKTGMDAESDDPIQIDNAPKEAAASISAAAKQAQKKKGGKKLSVPDFKKFRVLMIAGVALLIALIGFGYWAVAVAPKATITLRGETSDADLSFSIIADTGANSLDEEELIVPARQLENKKTETEKVPATGQKDMGTKAGGTVKVRNCSDDSVTVPAGTGISSGNLTYITQSALRLDEGEFSSPGSGGQCRTSGDHTGTVSVVAQSNGDQYNAPARSYSVAGFGGVTAEGDAMTGGSSKIAKVVAPQDVETAKQRIIERQQAVRTEMTKSLQQEGFVALSETFAAEVPAFSPTPAVDNEAAEVTVTAETTYKMLGVKESDLKKAVALQADKEDDIDTSKQSILDDGLDNARYVIGAKRGQATDITVSTKVVAGPEIDKPAIAKEIGGKKRGEAEGILKDRPGIREVRVETSPFWNSSVPKKENKVRFIIEEADGSVITD